MFGTNPTRPRDHSGTGALTIQGEAFDTIQGEGPLAGMPATFIRLWGCHLHCRFCDTDFESDARILEDDDLFMRCLGGALPLVVLTGGEPMRQNIAPLCRKLLAWGKLVQIETAGGFWLDGMEWDDVQRHPNFTLVVSPKTPGINYEVKKRANAWKYIISAREQQAPEDGVPIVNTQFSDGVPRKLARPATLDYRNCYLQPMDEQDPDKNKANVDRCIQLAMRFGYRVSMQLHKLWGLP